MVKSTFENLKQFNVLVASSDNIPWQMIGIVAEKIYQTRKKRGARILREERQFSGWNRRKMIRFHTIPDIRGNRFTNHVKEDEPRKSIFLSSRCSDLPDWRTSLVHCQSPAESTRRV